MAGRQKKHVPTSTLDESNLEDIELTDMKAPKATSKDYQGVNLYNTELSSARDLQNNRTNDDEDDGEDGEDEDDENSVDEEDMGTQTRGELDDAKEQYDRQLGKLYQQ